MGNLFLIFFLVLLLPVKMFLLEFYRIPSDSMIPTLKPGDHVYITKLGYGSYGLFEHTFIDVEPVVAIKRGEVLVFRFPGNESLNYIKRVIGLPGDRILVSDNQLYVNNQIVERNLMSTDDQGDQTLSETLDSETYQIILSQSGRRTFEKRWTVPEKSLFVLGDNRDRSNDSRYWGFVPTQNVVGKLGGIYRPFFLGTDHSATLRNVSAFSGQALTHNPQA